MSDTCRLLFPLSETCGNKLTSEESRFGGRKLSKFVPALGGNPLSVVLAERLVTNARLRFEPTVPRRYAARWNLDLPPQGPRYEYGAACSKLFAVPGRALAPRRRTIPRHR